MGKIQALLVLAALGFSSVSFADNRIDLISAEMNSAQGELSLHFRDSEAVASNCGYYVQSFEYLAAINTLNVQLASPEPCLVDRTGHREGQLKWTLPRIAQLRTPGTLSLIVNGKSVGKVNWNQD